VQPAGKLGDGTIAIPFEFVLDPAKLCLSPRGLLDTYHGVHAPSCIPAIASDHLCFCWQALHPLPHPSLKVLLRTGVYISVQYTLTVEVLRSGLFSGGNLSENTEFIVEVPTKQGVNMQSPAAFLLTSETVKKSRGNKDPGQRFTIKGQLNSSNVYVQKPLAGCVFPWNWSPHACALASTDHIVICQKRVFHTATLKEGSDQVSCGARYVSADQADLSPAHSRRDDLCRV
jgi:hypothetical protein